MWVSRKRFDALQQEVKDLREKVDKTHSYAIEELAPFRVGKMDYSYSWNTYLYSDRRPKVTLRQAIDMLREHLNVKWTKVDAVPERIELAKEK